MVAGVSMSKKTKRPAASELALLCARAAIDKKSNHSLIYDVGKLGAFTDYFLIVSGTSDRHARTIADEVCRAAKEHGATATAVEGHDEARWILVDFGDVVVHVFQDFIREFYDLESLWAEAPRLKIPEEFYSSPAARDDGRPALGIGR